MNWFLIAVVVGSVSAGIPGYWEPVDGVDDKCLMCGDPSIRKFSKTYGMITSATKTLMTQFRYDVRDLCKFEIDCVTASTFTGDGLNAPLWVDWCGISFWPHKKDDKFFRNWVLGQDLSCIGQRGQMFKGPMAISLAGGAVHTFPNSTENPNNWNGVEPPPGGCEPYIVYSDGMKKISIRSHSNPACGCGWAVDWYPCARKTCIVIWSEASLHSARSGELEGICGPMDGKANDWQTCHVDDDAPPSVPVDKNNPNAFEIISESCKHGKHNGQLYTGGTKMWNFCGQVPFPCV